MEFHNLEELKERLMPALRTKVSDLRFKNIMTIDEDDIWDFLANSKWKSAKDLNLSDMVSDILNFYMDGDFYG